METLINHRNLAINMLKVEEPMELEKIAELLGRAVSLVPRKGREIMLVGDGSSSYGTLNGRIVEYQKSYLPNGDPVTTTSDLTKERFLQLVSEKPVYFQEEVYKNLQGYLRSPNERRSKSEFSRNRCPEYCF